MVVKGCSHDESLREHKIIINATIELTADIESSRDAVNITRAVDRCFTGEADFYTWEVEEVDPT